MISALEDLGGPTITSKGARNVRAWLDRFVATPEWAEYFKNASVEHICSSRLDHLPILLRVGNKREWRPVDGKRKSIFRYEQMWERADTLKNTIENTWHSVGPAANLRELGNKIQHI